MSLNETINQLMHRSHQIGGAHDVDAGGVLADALDEAGHAHAPFFRNLVRQARYPVSWSGPSGRERRLGTYNAKDGHYHREDASTSRRTDPHQLVGAPGEVGHRFIPVVSDTGVPKWAVDRGVVMHASRWSDELRMGDVSHTAILDAPALREWASHPNINPSLRAALVNAANELEPHDPVKLALGLGGLVGKIRAYFSKPQPRDSRDGIVHTHAANPTAVYAEKNAVAQALRLLGAPDHMSRVDRYTAHIARFVNENPEHTVVKAYKDRAGVIGGTAGPELTNAVKPLVGVVNLLLAAHGLDERFKRPETEGKVAAFTPPPVHATSAEPAEPPIPADSLPAEPKENEHLLVRRLLQTHKNKAKVKAVLKVEHGYSHQEAHAAVQKHMELEGARRFRAFQREAKKNPDAKYSRPVKLSLNDDARTLYESSAERGGEHDIHSGGVLADLLDESGLPHGPFFRNLVRRAKHPVSSRTGAPTGGGMTTSGNYTTGDGQYYSQDRHGGLGAYPVVAGAGIGYHFIPVVSDTGQRKFAVSRGLTGRSPSTANELHGRPTHTAIMDTPALRQWADHEEVPPNLKEAIHRAADHLESASPTKLAKPKPGAAVEPEHLRNYAYDRVPINKALEGTTLAFHLRNIGQQYPELAPLVDHALARQATPGSAGGDVFARIGTRLKQKGDPAASLFNWDTLHESLIRDAKVQALVRKHVLQGAKLEGESDLTAERRYWDRVHRGLVSGRAPQAESFWARMAKYAPDMTREQIADSIRRLKDRALDQEYTAAVAAEKPAQRRDEHPELHWKGVLGAAPTEAHAKYERCHDE